MPHTSVLGAATALPCWATMASASEPDGLLRPQLCQNGRVSCCTLASRNCRQDQQVQASVPGNAAEENREGGVDGVIVRGWGRGRQAGAPGGL